MSQSVTAILDESPMSAGQYLAIVICVFLAAFDGFDILAIAFAAPGIAEEWGLSQGALGWVVTMELIGMAFGAAFMGDLADRIGRRPVILICIVIISVGMFAAAIAPNVYALSVIRILTGMGIGAVLASSNALVAELSNNRNRSSFILLITAGYAMGSIVGGLIASQLLKTYDWRSVFYLGGACTAIAFPLAYLFVHESISYLARRQPNGALEKINEILAKFGHEPISALPAKVADASKAGLPLLFSPKYLRVTVLLSFAYVAHVATYYFVLKWIPKLVVDMGYTASEGGSILVWANFGALAGCLTLAVATRVFDLRWLVISTMLSAAVFVVIFGHSSGSLTTLAMASVISGFFNSAAAGGLFPLLAKYFPTEVRAGGTGLVLAIGRGGAVAGPVIAGYLLQANIPLGQVAMLISLGSLAAAFAIWILGSSPTASEQLGVMHES